MILLGLFIALLIVIVLMCLKKKKIRQLAVLCCIIAGMLLIHVVGLLSNQPQTLSENSYDIISQIPWNDIDYLESIGFQIGESGRARYYSPDAIYMQDEHPSNHLDIIVFEDEVNAESLDEADYDQYEGIYIKENINKIYDNIFFEFIGVPSVVHRSYTIYACGREISVKECVDNGLDTILFGHFLKAIPE